MQEKNKDHHVANAFASPTAAEDRAAGNVRIGSTEAVGPSQEQPAITLQQRHSPPHVRPGGEDLPCPADAASPTVPEPSLASRSVPVSAAVCLSSPNTSRQLQANPSAALHGASFHLANRGASAFAKSGLSSSAELSRRLRGLLTTAVNFRDVELMAQPQALEGELMEQQDDTDADAATGEAAAAPPLPLLGAMRGSTTAADTAGGSAGGSSGGGSASGGAGGSAGYAGGDSGGGGGAGVGVGLQGMVSVAGSMGGQLSSSRQRTTGPVVRKNKLVIIMVGLPGRGKTFLCNKLCCYLNWLGHPTRHFNVGQYRRRQKPVDELQDASFFDHCNEAGVEARNRALNAALDDLMAWLRSDVGQVAVFDATNTTESRRHLLRAKFHGVWQYLFIETICSDPAILEQNYRNKMQYSPDYTGVDTDRAVADFLARIAKYEEVYEPIQDRNMHYIKLIDMVTGRGHMDINRISGYLPGKLVFFLMQDQTLSVAVWTSTLKRTIQTARFLPFPKLRWKALDEIDAGCCDGMTYEEIAERYPHEYEARKKDKLRYRYPAGESYMDVIQRVEPVIIELERERECVVVVAHQAVLRAVYAYFMNVPSEDIPRLSIPLHTLIELTPMPDGTMREERIPVDISARVSQLARSPSGTSGVELAVAAAVNASAAAAVAGVSPLSSMNSGASCRQDLGLGGLPVPASPAASGVEDVAAEGRSPSPPQLPGGLAAEVAPAVVAKSTYSGV